LFSAMSAVFRFYDGSLARGEAQLCLAAADERR
jgi:hypothetical protein